MMVFAFGILFWPLCAIAAGLTLHATQGRRVLEDGVLIRHFSVLLLICASIMWGASKTEYVRLKTDPLFALETALEQHPVYNTLKETAKDDHLALHRFLTNEVEGGRSLPEAWIQARPLLTRLANERLGFADQDTHVDWAQVTLDSLREVAQQDPALCYDVIASRPIAAETLADLFGADNTEAFYESVIAVYESAALGVSNRHPPQGAPVEFSAAALEYHHIQAAVATRFGEPVAKELSRKPLAQASEAMAGDICAARIFQLEEMLERPVPMAAKLTDSVLR
jgi:hypothetical protein